MPMRGNKGWSTAPGAGRPVTTGTRPQHQVRAFPEEWELIKNFSVLVKKDLERARAVYEAVRKQMH